MYCKHHCFIYFGNQAINIEKLQNILNSVLFDQLVSYLSKPNLIQKQLTVQLTINAIKNEETKLYKQEYSRKQLLGPWKIMIFSYIFKDKTSLTKSFIVLAQKKMYNLSNKQCLCENPFLTNKYKLIYLYCGNSESIRIILSLLHNLFQNVEFEQKIIHLILLKFCKQIVKKTLIFNKKKLFIFDNNFVDKLFYWLKPTAYFDWMFCYKNRWQEKLHNNYQFSQIEVNNSNINSKENELEVDEFIERLWLLRDKNNRSQMLTEEEMMRICVNIRVVFLAQPCLLDLKGPLKICGDIHGQFTDLLHLLELCGKPDTVNYLFLGDYVDRGRHSLETISLLFCYKLKYPKRFFMLRGNHESQSITRIYGFYDECKRRFSIRLWRTFVDTFNCLPFTAIIENQILCCHGGLSPEMMSKEIDGLDGLKKKIRSIVRPCDVPESGLLCDILWSDPWYLESTEDGIEPVGWQASERGVSYMFAPNIVDQFLERYNLDLIVRAHQVIEDGYEFYANRSLVTVFSAPNYCGEFDNAAAVFCLSRSNLTALTDAVASINPNASNLLAEGQTFNNVESDLEGSFQIIRSIQTKKKKSKHLDPFAN